MAPHRKIRERIYRYTKKIELNNNKDLHNE